ncbi:MAG: hypothetical protein QNL99_10335 [SAR86 cluster bacterium]|uniref:Glycine reductase n=1 Tax=SAR86 cluster bacterium TaxID=2030880 RepID=A0A972VY51_9GAMM|nr:hypothetical protein [SAR86 cluster bacterium]
MTARALEQAGICTVIIGSALDIVSHCGVPRYLHNNLPLGNPMGKPFDTKMQATTLRLALDLVISATAPVIQHTPFRWSESEAWRENYMRVDDSNREALRLAGEQNRQERLANKAKGLQRN